MHLWVSLVFVCFGLGWCRGESSFECLTIEGSILCFFGNRFCFLSPGQGGQLNYVSTLVSVVCHFTPFPLGILLLGALSKLFFPSCNVEIFPPHHSHSLVPTVSYSVAVSSPPSYPEDLRIPCWSPISFCGLSSISDSGTLKSLRCTTPLLFGLWSLLQNRNTQMETTSGTFASVGKSTSCFF